jgi:hypothetical protein
MAETLETIYLNNNLGATQFDSDQEETILTTDSNTRYVIKDMYVNGDTEYLTNTYLELNGFRVSSLAANATGSLIVGPNSTLKIKTTDYPFSVHQDRYIIFGTDNKIYVKEGFSISGSPIGSEDSFNTAASPSASTNVTDAIITDANNGTRYLHVATNDSNSSQVLYRYSVAEGYSGIRNVSYAPFGLSKTSFFGHAAFNWSSSTFAYQNLEANPSGDNFNSTFGNASFLSSYSPYPTSSYPRGDCHHGYYWYIPRGDGYPTGIFAINLFTGVLTYFNMVNSVNMGSATSANFTVGYDPIQDRFIIYRSNDNTDMYYDIPNITKTQMDAKTSQSTITNLSTGDFPISRTANNVAQGVLGYDGSGNVTYRNSSSLFTVDLDGNTVNEESSVSINGANISPSSTSVFTKRSKILSSAEIAANNLTSELPTFGVQILGIKSQNV